MESKLYSIDLTDWTKNTTDEGITKYSYNKDVIKENLPEDINLETVNKVLEFYKDVKNDSVIASTLIAEKYFKENDEAKEVIVEVPIKLNKEDSIQIYTNKEDDCKVVFKSISKFEPDQEILQKCTQYLLENL